MSTEIRRGSLADKIIKFFGFMIGIMAILAVGLFLLLDNNTNILLTGLVMIGCSFIFGNVTLTWLRRDLVDPLNGLSSAVSKIVEGDLGVSIPAADSNDELGVLINNFNVLIDNLKDDRRKISEAVGVLAAAVEQILNATSASASGASQTAATVTETTIAAEEVRQTTMIATENSRFVADLAEETAKVSLEGRRATEDTVMQMTRMRQQMATIADGMSGLLEKSQAIVEITTTVDDLAQQSNLLAVNAAVEAARAGELGKGFSVVAQEVKALAALSKEATAEVRRILEDIQKATAGAAVSIEQGSGMVEAAVKQSSEAGNAIEALTRSVSEAASAASQIAAANQEQLVGIDQVVTAMQGIQGAMKQHAGSSRDIDAAAQKLNSIRDTLLVLVNRYRV
ncbi:MAG: methyl-accepting chemotaxis protein [Candidatus Obscuribacterales bacterium]|nr:methyl-accepting chemotaxis protein [Candidatus Obscuribacterales bacterium]